MENPTFYFGKNLLVEKGTRTRHKEQLHLPGHNPDVEPPSRALVTLFDTLTTVFTPSSRMFPGTEPTEQK